MLKTSSFNGMHLLDTHARHQLLTDCDRCVKCGMCLPECPTYELERDENASPRGRIALIQAWQSGKLPLNDRLVTHLEECLVCRRCERMCPSLVPFGNIITTARQQIYAEGKRKTSLATRLMLRLVEHPGRMKSFALLISLYRYSGLRALLRHSGLLRILGLAHLDRQLPLINPASSLAIGPAPTTNRGRLGLFTGCMSNSMDRQTVNSAIQVLTRLGYEVIIPDTPHCCGALHWQQGDIPGAIQLAEQTLAMMQEHNVENWISLVNGCTVQLKDFEALPLSDKAQQQYSLVREKIIDLVSFLAHADWPDDLPFNSIEQEIYVHLPCSLKNGLRAERDFFKLLARLPGKNLPTSAINRHCCGAAGSYVLNQPKIATQLRDETLKVLSAENELILLTTNLGCAMHLRSGLENPEKITVMHPVTLIGQLLAASDG